MPYKCKWCEADFYTRSSRDAHEENCSENPSNEE